MLKCFSFKFKLGFDLYFCRKNSPVKGSWECSEIYLLTCETVHFQICLRGQHSKDSSALDLNCWNPTDWLVFCSYKWVINMFSEGECELVILEKKT